MPTLQVRNLPQSLYDKLVAAAESERRSVAQQTIVLLEIALKMEETQTRRVKALESLLSRKLEVEIDPVKLVREDRER